MDREEVRTRTKDRILTDVVLNSPVDEYQARFRRRAGMAMVAALIVLMAAVAL